MIKKHGFLLKLEFISISILCFILREPQRMPRSVGGDEFVSIFWTRCAEYAVGSCLAVCFVVKSLHGNQKNQSCSL